MNYTLNLTTGRVELTDLTKEDYKKLDTNLQKSIKSYFLFLRNTGVWGSKATKNYPYLNYQIKRILKELNFTNQLVSGEQLSYSEHIDKKSKKAEIRTEKYLTKSKVSENKSTEMQESYKKYAGDIAFVTQPNINSSKGRTFTNYRNRLIKRYEQGFEEYRKSEEYKRKAITADKTAKMQNLKNKTYLQNRIDECDSMLRSIKRLIDVLEEYETNNTKAINHDSSYKNKLILLEQYTDKKAFFLNCLDDLGGVEYSKDNIKKGNLIKINYGWFKVIRANPKTVTIMYDTCKLKVLYASILGINKELPPQNESSINNN